MHLRFAFGINTEIPHNLAYSDDHKILFPVGRHISCYDFQSKEVRCVRQRWLTVPVLPESELCHY